MPRTKAVFALSSALIVAALLLTACEESAPNPTTPKTTTTATTATTQAEAPSGWKLETMPEGALEVIEAKAGAKEGDPITVVGRIGGRSEPISAESGLFIIMDPALPACSDNPEDRCAKPWDYCCETQETITANAATIQLRDAEGNPIVLEDGELQPLSRVTVVGTVAARPNKETLVVLASGVYVQAAE